MNTTAANFDIRAKPCARLEIPLHDPRIDANSVRSPARLEYDEHRNRIHAIFKSAAQNARTMRIGEYPSVARAHGPDAIAQSNFWSADRIAAGPCPNLPFVAAFWALVTDIGRRRRLAQRRSGAQRQQGEQNQRGIFAMACLQCGNRQPGLLFGLAIHFNTTPILSLESKLVQNNGSAASYMESKHIPFEIQLRLPLDRLSLSHQTFIWNFASRRRAKDLFVIGCGLTEIGGPNPCFGAR